MSNFYLQRQEILFDGAYHVAMLLLWLGTKLGTIQCQIQLPEGIFKVMLKRERQSETSPQDIAKISCDQNSLLASSLVY